MYSTNEMRFKIYIIDEVHMLSTAAFNALLKTLEEPPNNTNSYLQQLKQKKYLLLLFLDVKGLI